MMRTRLLIPVVTFACVIPGCEQYRVEYHNRPDFYQKASPYELPGEIELDDGTRIVYQSPIKRADGVSSTTSGRKRFSLREELKDGTVRLSAVIPEHVLINTLVCLRREEYALLWDQMLATRTKSAYEEREDGYAEFEAYMREHRTDLGRTLTRMVSGLPHQEVAMASMGEGITRCVLRPQHSTGFRFTIVDVIREDDGQMKLMMMK